MSNMTPETRKEHWMARAAGEDELVLEPQTREEHWWQKIIDAIESGGGGGGAVSSVNGQTGAVVLTAADLDDSFKDTLLACFAHVAWTSEHGHDYYDALESALYPPAGLVSISAVYTQSGTVYDTDSLDSLRADLVVTATYNNGDVRAVSDYVLSGTLTVGTSTITVSYGGKTTTFDVTVMESAIYTLTENDFLRGYGNMGTYGPEPHYAGAAANRISYNKFDLLLEAGKQYVVAATATAAYKDSAEMALQYFNQNALNTVASNGTIATANIDTNTNNWGNLSITITVPATINNSPTKGARITFRQSSANPSISSDFGITSLTISEVSA